MYEIWLAINIAWEIALGVWPLLLALLLVWLGLLVAARRQGLPAWKAALPRSALVGLALAVLTALTLPMLTKSSLAEMAYWVDWANLFAIAAAAGCAGLVFSWPLLALRGGAQAPASGGVGPGGLRSR